VPPKVSTTVTTPGLGAATIAIRNYKSLVDGVAFGVIADFRALERASQNAPTGPHGYLGGTMVNGRFQRYSVGGSVFGGPPGRDTVPAFLDNGEEVIRKGPAAKFRPLLKAINNAPGFAAGGTVGANLSDIFSLIVTPADEETPADRLRCPVRDGHDQHCEDGRVVHREPGPAGRDGFGFLAMQLSSRATTPRRSLQRRP